MLSRTPRSQPPNTKVSGISYIGAFSVAFRLNTLVHWLRNYHYTTVICLSISVTWLIVALVGSWAKNNRFLSSECCLDFHKGGNTAMTTYRGSNSCKMGRIFVAGGALEDILVVCAVGKSTCLRHASIVALQFESHCRPLTTGVLCSSCAPTSLQTKINLVQTSNADPTWVKAIISYDIFT